MTRIACGEVALDYAIDGSRGEWILMIQGLGYAKWGWKRQVPTLSEKFRVITFDNRGVGESDSPPGPYTAAQMAQDAAGLLSALEIEQAHVVGASLGGFIAQELTLSNPDLVDRLVLACTGFGGPRFVPMPQATVMLLARFPELDQLERYRLSTENGFTPEFVRDNPGIVDEIIRHRIATDQGFEPWSWQAGAGATFDASGRVSQIENETLVITGTSDNVVDHRNSDLLASEIPNSTLEKFHSGHLFFIEQYQAVNRALESFLAGDTRESEVAQQ